MTKKELQEQIDALRQWVEALQSQADSDFAKLTVRVHALEQRDKPATGMRWLNPDVVERAMEMRHVDVHVHDSSCYTTGGMKCGRKP